MSFRFRFPIALLDSLKLDNSKTGYTDVLEKAREWAVASADEKRKRPSLTEADVYLQEIIEDDKDDRAKEKAHTSY